MIKIMIVDDEKIIRTGIKNKIDCTDNLACYAEARDGVEALQIALNIRPDIVITDIRMPQMDGIEFIGQLRQLLPDIQTIFVSSYNDFSYIKSALDFESCAYILKPVKKQELNDAVKKAVRKIQNNNLLHFTSQMQLELLDKFLISFYNQIPVSPTDFENLLDGLHFQSPYFQLLLVRLLESSSTADYVAQALNTTIAFFSSVYVSRIVAVSQTTYIAFISSPESIDALALSKSLIRQLSIRYSMDVSIVLGRQADSLLSIPDSFTDARDGLNLLHLYNIHEIILPQENLTAPELSSADIPLPSAITEEIIDSIYIGSSRKLDGALSRLEQFIRNTPALTLYGINHIFSQLLSDILRILYERQCPKEIINQGISLMYKFSTCSLWEDFFDRFQDYCATILSAFRKATSIEEIIHQAEAYMQAHYSENLSLKKLAALYYLNISYFSTSFKTVTGKNFNEYLTEIRMENAKKLLANKSVKISEAAALSGYDDTSYFGKSFRRYTGMLPSEYRRQLLLNK